MTKLNKIKTEFDETIKVGSTIYYLESSTFGKDKSSIDIDLYEIKVSNIIDRRLTLDVDIEIIGKYKIISKLAFNDRLDANRISVRLKKVKDSIGPGFFYEKKNTKKFFSELDEANKAFFKK